MRSLLLFTALALSLAACSAKISQKSGPTRPQSDEEKMVLESQDLEGATGKFAGRYRGNCLNDVSRKVYVSIEQSAATIQVRVSSDDDKALNTPEMFVIGNGLVAQAVTLGKIGTNGIFYEDSNANRIELKLTRPGVLGLSQSGPGTICATAILYAQ